MIESIKNKIWNLLEEKEVSLAMLYNREGEILWHRGRRIRGRTINEGEGFSKSHIHKTLRDFDALEKEDVVIVSNVDEVPESALILHVKSLIIQPVNNRFFLYIDSGTRDSFSETDREIIEVLGGLLGEMVEQIRKNEVDTGGITGTSEEIEKIRDLALKYSLEEEAILLHGETGSGKSHIAELIHKFSGRKGKFFTVNTPGIPANLFESEIFGHKKGAFTDARSDKKGFVDEASGGTLFFDEISEVPLSFQVKLLRFIETKKYNVLGESGEKAADVRIVAATNKDLHRAIEDKEFREDLYYRLNVLEIEIPPLRKRKQDIKALVLENMHCLKGKEIAEDFWESVYRHEWPGNVRELITVLTRAGIHLESPITGEGIKQVINQSLYKKSFESKGDTEEEIWQDIRSGKDFWEAVKKPFLNRDIKREEVRAVVHRGLQEADNKYKKLIKIFNVEDKDYHKFMTFLTDYKLK